MSDSAETVVQAPGLDEYGRTAEEARRAHSIVSALTSGWTVWFALLGGFAAWIIHLLAFVALSELSTRSADSRWAMHGITVVTMVMTIASIWLSVRLTREPGERDGGDVPSAYRFVGQLGILFGIINGMLILLEELYLNIIRRSGVA